LKSIGGLYVFIKCNVYTAPLEIIYSAALSALTCYLMSLQKNMGCGGSLVDLTPFVRMVAGLNLALAAT